MMELTFSLIMSAAGLIASYTVMRVNLAKNNEALKAQGRTMEELKKFMNEKSPLLVHLSTTKKETAEKLEKVGKDIVALKMEIKEKPTMKEVRDDFVSKEVYMQLEKHMDRRFNSIEGGINKIVKTLEGLNGWKKDGIGGF